MVMFGVSSWCIKALKWNCTRFTHVVCFGQAMVLPVQCTSLMWLMLVELTELPVVNMRHLSFSLGGSGTDWSGCCWQTGDGGLTWANSAGCSSVCISSSYESNISGMP